MADRTESNDITLREYIEARLEAAFHLSDQRFASLEQATKLALATNNERWVQANEWRSALSDMINRFATNDRVAQEVRRIEELIGPLRDAMNVAHGKASQSSVNLAFVVAILGLLISLGGLLLAVAR